MGTWTSRVVLFRFRVTLNSKAQTPACLGLRLKGNPKL